MIEDPMRFGRARDVGAYLGLLPRHHQSGEVDRSGRISKQGDALLRGYLHERLSDHRVIPAGDGGGRDRGNGGG
jgi:transposase